MAHKIELGVDRMATTRLDTVWHRDETLQDGRLVLVTADASDNEATLLKMAGVVWPASADNDIARTVGLVTADGTPVESHIATVSPSGRVLGVVTAGYEQIPFRVILTEWLLALARWGGIPETLGTFDGGRNMFGSLQVADAWRVPGDTSLTRPLFNVVSNHTGSGGIRGSFATFRVVCANTASMYTQEHDAIADARQRADRAWVSIRHTANAQERIQDAVAWIVDGRGRAEREQAMLARLAAKAVSAAEVDRFMERYIAKPDQATSRTSAIREAQRDAFLATLRDSADLGDHALRGSRGTTAYGLLQAVTHFEDYVARANKTDDTPVSTRRAFRAFMGEREAEKTAAREYIAALAS